MKALVVDLTIELTILREYITLYSLSSSHRNGITLVCTKCECRELHVILGT